MMVSQRKHPTCESETSNDPIPLRVVTVTNNLIEYPQYKEESYEFPHLVHEIGDEVETFIIGDDDYWRTRDFFLLGGIKHFVITEGFIE